MFKLDTSAITFKDDGAGNAIIDGAVPAGAVTEVNALDADILLNGPSTLSDATKLKEGATFKAQDGSEVTLDQAKLDGSPTRPLALTLLTATCSCSP